MPSLSRFASTAVLTLAVLPLGGCLVTGSSKETMTGTHISPTTFSNIEPGVTTETWVRAALGEPTSRSELDDGSSLWRWSFRRDKTSSSAVFLIFGGSSRKESEGATFVQLKDGIVVKAWQD